MEKQEACGENVVVGAWGPVVSNTSQTLQMPPPRQKHDSAEEAEKLAAHAALIKKAKKGELKESSLTCSLKIEWAENDLMNLVRPGVEQYQKIRSPVGASASKSNNLLRNTFSQEVYNEFLKYKIEKKQQNAIKEVILEEQDELLDELRAVKQEAPPAGFMRT